jgi:hypothetical protein
MSEHLRLLREAADLVVTQFAGLKRRTSPSASTGSSWTERGVSTLQCCSRGDGAGREPSHAAHHSRRSFRMGAAPRSAVLSARPSASRAVVMES